MPCAVMYFPVSLISSDSNGSLLLLVLHLLVDAPELRVQVLLVQGELLQLGLQALDVGLEQGLTLRGRPSLSIQHLPLGLQHFILLLQVPHLRVCVCVCVCVMCHKTCMILAFPQEYVYKK